MAKKRNKVKIYSIIHTNHGKQKEIICSLKTEKEAYTKFNDLLKENKNVLFPVMYNNEKHMMVEAEHELVIIKCKDEFENDINKIKTDSGEFANYKTNDENWIVIDRAPYNIEETFWVYGYHPKLQRKTFKWIYENLLERDSKNKYMFKNVLVYNNKLLIETVDSLEMVICKNKHDSIRLFNLLESFAKTNKFKYIIFMGDIAHSKYKREYIAKIQKMTGWNSRKIRRMSTRD